MSSKNVQSRDKMGVEEMLNIWFFLFVTFLSVNVFSVNCFDKIPKKIWQTYLKKQLPAAAREAQCTWLINNGNFHYSIWDDQNIENYIISSWSREMYDFFCSLPLGVMKADLWRYLIITTEGGVYSDIDSVCNKPIKTWLPDFDNGFDNILLLALENDLHFCQWTIAATTHHPAMEFVCAYILENWKRNGIDLSNLHFVHATTGPGIWTQALVEYLGEPKETSAGDIYRRYETSGDYRKKLNKLGVFLFPATFFAGDMTQNLYGSTTFKDGYKNWVEEATLLNKRVSTK